MDVICDRCKAEYEFDEALLGDKGTTVKCSACGHVFRVLPPNRDAARSQLKLRFAKDGSVKTIGSLRELQQRIRGGEVSLDDELGREGFPFRSLRDVPELKNFFTSVPARATLRPEASHVGGLPVAPNSVPAGTTLRPEASRVGGLPVAPNSVPAGTTLRPEASRVGGLPVAPSGARPEREERSRPSIPSPTVPVPGPSPASTLLGNTPTARPPTGMPPVHPSAHPPASRSPSATASAQPQTIKPSPESRERSFGRGTMMGVGPADLQLPPPPRVPHFGAGSGAAKPSASRTSPPPARIELPEALKPARERAQGLPDKTLSGAPAPDLGAAATQLGKAAPPLHTGEPAAPARPPLHANASFDRGGTASPISPSAAAAVSAVAPLPAASGAGRSPPAQGGEPARRGVAPFEPAPLVISPSVAPPSTRGASQRPLPAASFAASDASDTGHDDDHEGSADGPVEPLPKLYLDDDERPPERAVQPTSKAWLYAALLLLAAAGTWFAVQGLRTEPGTAAAPAAAVTPEPTLQAEASVAAEVVDAGASQGAYATPEFAPPVALEAATGAAAGQTGEAPAKEEQRAAPDDDGRGDADDKAQAKPGAGQSGESDDADKASTRKSRRDKAAAKLEGDSTETDKAEADQAEARERPSRSAGSDPSDYGGWVNRGDQLFSRGDHEGANKAYRAALALRPTGSEANAGLGFALLNGGQARDALPFFDRAASSGYAEANIGLGDAYRKLGQPSSAKEAYQAYLDRLPNGARADYARSAIDKLKGGSSASADKPASAPSEPEPAQEPAPREPAPSNEYRPAGELIEPSAPPTTTPESTP
jgi:predicted Zn finger-like uncharacterized protein